MYAYQAMMTITHNSGVCLFDIMKSLWIWLFKTKTQRLMIIQNLIWSFYPLRCGFAFPVLVSLCSVIESKMCRGQTFPTKSHLSEFPSLQLNHTSSSWRTPCSINNAAHLPLPQLGTGASGIGLLSSRTTWCVQELCGLLLSGKSCSAAG